MNPSNEISRKEREVYDSIAEAYDSRFASYGSLFASDLIDLLFPQKGEAALDIAGGSGIPGLKLAERIGKEGTVTIIDVSPEMLLRAAKNAAVRQLVNVQCRIMNAEKVEFADRAFDIVTCVQGIQYVSDVPGALREAHRVLKSRGRIGFCVWSIPERTPFYCEPMTAFIRRKLRAYLRPLISLPGIGPRKETVMITLPAACNRPQAQGVHGSNAFLGFAQEVLNLK